MAPPGYYARIREICDRHGVLFIADEVLCGVGRTGTFFALEQYKDRDGEPIRPDIITLGKGLNGGYAPLSAMLTTQTLFEAMKASKLGGLMHAQTYSQHPVAAAAGLATLRYIAQHRLVERAASLGALLQSSLKTLSAQGEGAGLVGDVRGIGMLAGVELVADRATKRPFARERKVVERLVDAGLRHGIVLWPNTGQADGVNGDLVLIAPPLVITQEEIQQLVARLRSALADVAREIAA